MITDEEFVIKKQVENQQNVKFLKAYKDKIEDLTRVVFADQIVVVLDSPTPTRTVATQD